MDFQSKNSPKNFFLDCLLCGAAIRRSGTGLTGDGIGRRVVPKAAVSRCSKDPVSKPRLFDHLVSGREQRRRNGQTKRFRGLEIEYELELGRLFHWNIAEFGPA
jgi:hypothetical protein